MANLWIFSNTVRAADGRTVGTFSNHAAAFAALMRATHPGWVSLSGEPSGADAAEEKKMAERLANR